jgi:tetratricopeptide (TPR) repeat protein
MTLLAQRTVRFRWPIAALLIVLGTLTTRATLEQQAAWARAVAFEKQGKLDDAIDEYRWTLRWYVPWGLTDEAGQALVDLGNRASPQEPERAVRALDALRSGLIASRSLWQPRADLLAYANRGLPSLLVRVADRQGDKRDPKVLLAQFTRDYLRPVGVSPVTSAAVSLGFLLWLAGLVMVVRRGVDDAGKWLPAGWRWLGASLAGFTVWVLGMWLG